MKNQSERPTMADGAHPELPADLKQPTYLTTEQLARRIHYDARTIRTRLKDTVLREGVHYIRPFGGRKLLFVWETIRRDIGVASSNPGMAVPLVSPDPTTVTVRTRYDSGHLILEFKYRGVKCSEETALNDTPVNRKRVQAFADRLERDLELGTFDYALYFPASPRAAKFSAPASHSTPSALLEPLEPAFPRDAQPWKADELAQVVAVIHDAGALTALATQLGRTERSLRERYQRLLTEANSPPRPNTRTLAPRWTELELDWMREQYAAATPEEITARFPYRRLLAVRCRASEMGLTLTRREAALQSREHATDPSRQAVTGVAPPDDADSDSPSEATVVYASAADALQSPGEPPASSEPAAESPSVVLTATGTDVATVRTPSAQLPPLPSYPEFHGIQGWTPAELVHVLHLLSMRTPLDEIARTCNRPLGRIYVVSLHLGISPRQPRYLSDPNEARLVQLFQKGGLRECAAHFQAIPAKELRTRLVVAGIMACRSIAWLPHEICYLRHSMKVDRNVTEVAYNLLVSRDVVHSAAERVLRGKRPKPVRPGSHRRQHCATP